MTHLHTAIQNLLNSLPTNMIVILIYDKADNIVGFAIVDREDKTKARIFDLNGMELSDVPSKIKLTEADNTLQHEHAFYVS
jgi:hypothetical protein